MRTQQGTDLVGHYLFLEAHSLRRASLSENCSLLGTDNVRRQISDYIFAPNEGYCLYISLSLNWLQRTEKRPKILQNIITYTRRIESSGRGESAAKIIFKTYVTS